MPPRVIAKASRLVKQSQVAGPAAIAQTQSNGTWQESMGKTISSITAAVTAMCGGYKIGDSFQQWSEEEKNRNALLDSAAEVSKNARRETQQYLHDNAETFKNRSPEQNQQSLKDFMEEKRPGWKTDMVNLLKEKHGHTLPSRSLGYLFGNKGTACEAYLASNCGGSGDNFEAAIDARASEIQQEVSSLPQQEGLGELFPPLVTPPPATQKMQMEAEKAEETSLVISKEADLRKALKRPTRQSQYHHQHQAAQGGAHDIFEENLFSLVAGAEVLMALLLKLCTLGSLLTLVYVKTVSLLKMYMVVCLAVHLLSALSPKTPHISLWESVKGLYITSRYVVAACMIASFAIQLMF